MGGVTETGVFVGVSSSPGNGVAIGVVVGVGELGDAGTGAWGVGGIVGVEVTSEMGVIVAVGSDDGSPCLGISRTHPAKARSRTRYNTFPRAGIKKSTPRQDSSPFYMRGFRLATGNSEFMSDLKLMECLA